ncbi:MAG: hypothetical protein IJR09_01625 [Paludibacteraceae bacterium]|nr:hypothetical protein [Paludibacteraceae bacterium]
MTKTNLITQVVRLFAPVMLMCTSTLVCAEDMPLVALFTETDTTYYADFVSALKEANKREKATMQLWDDVRFGGPAAAQTVKTNLCIDLNGYSLGDTLSGTSLLTLKTDTLTLRITSSRPGGRIWAARAYNGKFSVLNITNGALEVSHVRIEAHNTLPYDASSAKSVAASCVTMAAPTSLTMDDCRLVCEAEKSATAVSGAGNAGTAAEISIRNSTILSRGRTSIYGVNVYSKTQIEDCRIEAEGTESTVYGVNVNLYRDTVQDIEYEASIKGVQVRVTGESKIYGVYAKSGIVLHNDSIDVQGKTTVCGVHGDRDLQAEGCVIGVKADSTSAEGVSVAAASKAVVRHCHITADATEGKASGFVAAGNAGAAADVTFAHNEVRVQGVSAIYGVNVYSKAQIEDCRIEAEGTENTVYGVNISHYRDTAQGIDYEASIKGVQVRVTGESKIYGVYAKGGIVLHNDSIDVQGKTTVCGVHGDKNLQAEGCVIGVKADSTSAEGVSVAAASKAVVRHCHITAGAPEGKASGFAAAGNAGAAADVTFAHNEVRVQGVSTIYGVNVYSKAQIEDCRIEAEATENTVYGVNISHYRDTAQGIDYEASIKGVQVRVTGGSTIYGVYSKAPVVMEQDTVSVRTHGTTAYGIHGLNGLQATGCQIEAEALREDTLKNLYGINAGGEVSLEHCDISARAGSDKAEEAFKSTVYGVALSNSSHATMSGCHVHVLSSGAATAVSGAGNASTAADVTINDNRIEAYGAATVHGVNCYSRAAIEQCRITAQSGLSNANGMNISIFQDSIHGEYETVANRLTIDVRAHDKAYGIQSKGPLEMAQDTIHVEADSVTAYGVNATFSLRASACEIEAHGLKTVYGINCNNRSQVTECRIEAEANESTAYGMYINHFADSTEVEQEGAVLRGLSIRCTTPTLAYGVYSRSRMKMTESTIACEATHSQAWAFYLYSGEAEVSDCHAEVRSGTQQAYGVYTLNGCTGAVFTDCLMKATAPEDGSVIRYNKNAVGRLYFYGGYYSDKDRLSEHIADSSAIYRLWDHDDEYVQGYRYTIQPSADPNAIVACIFEKKSDEQPTNRFYRIAEAIEYMNAHAEERLTVMVVGSCVLPKGEYKVPKGCSLVVAYDDEQTRAIGPKALHTPDKENRYRHACLALEDSVVIYVEGVLETSALQKSAGSGVGGVTGEYGLLQLSPSSRIVLEKGAEMQAWGIVRGEGEIEVMDGATVHEGLQIGDWNGASVIFSMLNNEQGVFPLTHYFYQNIESSVLYHSGAKALGSTAATVMDMEVAYDDIQLISKEKGLFVMADDGETTVRKRYDSRSDRLEWTVNGDVTLDELGITFSAGIFGRYSLISSAYTLPICTNMSIMAESGELRVLHDAVLLPGAAMRVGADARLVIPDGVSVYLYDTAQWGMFNGNAYYTVAWTPDWEVSPRDSVLVPARLEVGGMIDVQGALFATESGAQVVGTDDSEGVVRIAHNGQTGSIWQLTGDTESYDYTESPVTSVPLRNADGTRVETERTGDYVYREGVWNIPKEKPDDPNEGLVTPENGGRQRAVKIIDGSGCVIITPDGRRYTILGQPL